VYGGKAVTKHLVVLMITGLLATGAIRLQEPKMEAPKPAPETERLDYFTGNWHSEVDIKANPWEPVQKMSSELHCSWMEGRFFVVCNEIGQWSLGKLGATYVMGYDSEAKVYTWDSYNSAGKKGHITGTVEGKTWTFNIENEVDGKTIKARSVLFEESPTRYRLTMEATEDGKTWKPVMESQSNKVVSAKSK
jgi:hypothetical protein